MSLKYRKQRFQKIRTSWNLEEVNPLYMSFQIPEELLKNFKIAVMLYIAKACKFEFTENEEEFIVRLDKIKSSALNVTPNGAVVPKREYQLEYNLVLREWSQIVSIMIEGEPSLLNKYRMTPNIRIKFKEDFSENNGRVLNTSYPHSDAWLEGPWGMNCHVPLLGDCQKNYLAFFKLKNEEEFDDSLLAKAASYEEMQWVLKFYERDNITPRKGCVNVSDYALIHQTMREPNCGTRVSIDTTLFVGDHEVHPDRELEYVEKVPAMGEDVFIACRLRTGELSDKKTTFSHYTTGNLQTVRIF